MLNFEMLFDEYIKITMKDIKNKLGEWEYERIF